MSSVLCEKQEAAAAEKKSEVTDKKHDKRGIYDEGYGDFGGGGWGHDFEEDHHHLHHHHEKTIVNVKKVNVFVALEIFLESIFFPHIFNTNCAPFH